MSNMPEPALEPAAAAETAEGSSAFVDDASPPSLSNSTATNDSCGSGRPYTPSSLPGTPGTPASSVLHDETASYDDEQSEADSASASGTTAPMFNPTQRQKHLSHRHISRSAAKRDSVASLPSIQNLRLHFSNGARTEYRAGHGVGISGGLGAMPEDGEEPSSQIGLGRPSSQPWKNVQLMRVGPDQARAEASQLAAIIRKRWGVDRGLPNSATPPPERSADVRAVFIETARAVRKVRTLSLSLVPPGVGHRRVSGPPKNGPAFSTPSRPAKPISRTVSGPAAAAAPKVPDPTMPVRRAAIELLGNLRAMEERVRLTHDTPVVVVIPEAGESALVTSPVDEQGSPWSGEIPDRYDTISPPPDIRRLSLSARLSVSSLEDSFFSEDEDWTINDLAREAEARDRPHETWEDRLITEDRAYKILDGGQWAVKSMAIREAARRWADAVDQVFGQHETGTPAISWISSGSSDLERARAFLTAHLEPEHAALLPASDDDLLNRLSDGYLLVQAYNALVYSSSRQWGFIPEDDVHDTIRTSSPPPDDSEAKESKEWTFRRVGNLTAWAAAIRLRYNLPIVLPHSAVLAPPTLPDGKPIPRAVSSSVKKKDAPRIDFDPLLVAKHDPEGENMLKGLLAIWVSEAEREVMGSPRDGVKEVKEENDE